MNSNNIKVIILAGGAGTRLSPLTKIISKQLLPVYDKPMIYYPISTLVSAGIEDILIITTKKDQKSFKLLLGNGSDLGVKISYEIQEKPEGIAQAFQIADEWLENSSSILILGDNLIFGNGLEELIKKAINNNIGASLFGYEVKDPDKFGVIEFDKDHNVKRIIEKPEKFISNWAVTGLYIYDSNAPSFSRNLNKSSRGEYEITDLNMIYLSQGNLKVTLLDQNYKWLDTGSFDSLLEAAQYVKENE